MRIGFDLDRVFINYPPFLSARLINWRYKQKENGELLYRIPKKPEQMLRIILHYSIFRPAMNENIKLLRKLDHEHNKLFLISSRFGFLKKRTEIIMKRYGLSQYFDEVFFNYKSEQPHEFKEKVLKKLDLDMYIDDDLSILKFVAKTNKKIKLYWLNYEYSKPLGDNLFAVKSLSDIFSSLIH